MKITKKVAGIAIAGMALLTIGGAANAASVTCGDLSLGTRTVTIDPALEGGLCLGYNGNLDSSTAWNTFAASLGIAEVDKDTTSDFPSGDPSEGALQFTRTSDVSGGWEFAETLWDTYDRLFIGFHFGGGGDTADTNPDSFVVELAPRFWEGTYLRSGGTQQALSNIYLFGIRCTEPNGCNPPPDEVPEPGTLALLGLGLVGLGFGRRRKI